MKLFNTVLIVLLSSVSLLAQYQIHGKVTNIDAEPLVGATIVVMAEGTSEKIGSVTDQDGNFSLINIPNSSDQLEVSYLGFKTKIISINPRMSKPMTISLLESALQLSDIEVKGTWAGENSPFAFDNVDGETLASQNNGQDLPYLLRGTPSLIATSDAGAGIGYTGLRIRGSDATRINVTINGIPLNDPESQSVFWVNMPDFAGSTESIQIQRGVGTSTNGAGAFGATVNLQTNARKSKPYGEIFNSFGSFNSRKHSLKLGTGVMQSGLSFDGRVSFIHSDGYIDRASSDLSSTYLSAGYYGSKTIVKAIYFSGREKTYQSWYGTPAAIISGDIDELNAYADRNFLSDEQRENLLNSGRTYNFYEYENETDNYGQDHYQLHFGQVLGAQSNLNMALHYTKGAGYFEQEKLGDDFSDYGLADQVVGMDTISDADFIRQRWLDNDFVGYTANYQYKSEKLHFTIGNAFNKYFGDHFGEIIWASIATDFSIGERYYDNRGEKSDLNFFAKVNYNLDEDWNLFADMQYRQIGYQVKGVDSDLRDLDAQLDYNFFNPKAGILKRFGNGHQIFGSIAVGNKEPSRGDLIDAVDISTVKPEQLLDIELGYKLIGKKIGVEVNFYNMSYKDQLVATGALNDVGSAVRVNVPDSYRRGVELQLDWAPLDKLRVSPNLTLSQNKIKNFTETVYDYTNGYEVIENKFSDTEIAFSPSIISNTQVGWTPIKALSLIWNAKFVGQQFLDNTSSELSVIPSYFVNDLNVSFNPRFGTNNKTFKGLTLKIAVNNIFNEEYSSNGYTFGYIFEERVIENFYYPQAGINFLAGLELKF